ncbi:peptide-methionine (S)-S-oxide reductase MsrA [Desulfobaculum bizertense]|nr:peptide-methionine (S)-S-oxide reductase MsrA [Desulfobaculum bizertense]UIJ37569.1 peptide-methionine (S)-S-oxide reductase MsrA [Desulfobaculum bizertense]
MLFRRIFYLGLGVMLFSGSMCFAAEAGLADTGKPATAIFAGGCFWCMEKPFDSEEGVLSTTVGYTGGTSGNPTYEQVSGGGTGHVEAILVRYDTTKVSYERLLEIYWRNVDPLDGQGQFCDRGNQYRPVIFVADKVQEEAAKKSKADLALSGLLIDKIRVEILPAVKFWPAEEYHQDYYRKNPIRYGFYRKSCGRDKRLKQVWKDAK